MLRRGPLILLLENWSTGRGLNPRIQVLQTCALATSPPVLEKQWSVNSGQWSVKTWTTDNRSPTAENKKRTAEKQWSVNSLSLIHI